MVAYVLVATAVVVLLPYLLSRWRISWFLYVLCMISNGIGFNVAGAVVRPEHLGIVFLLAAVVGQRRETPEVRRHRISPWIWVSLSSWLLFAGIASIFRSPQPVSSLYIVVWTAASIFALMVTLRYMEKREELVTVGTYAIGLVSALSLLAWAANQTLGLHFPLTISDTGDAFVRIVGLSFEPNIMGAICCLWFALVLYWRERLTRRVLVISIVIAMAGVLTMTRATWFSLGIILLLTLLRRRKPVTQNIVGVFLISLTVILSMGSGGPTWLLPLLDRASSIFTLDSGTAAFRITSWRLAFSDIQSNDSILTGLGSNSFSQRHGDLVSTARIDYLSNAWIAQLYDSGLIGLTLLLVGLFALWRRTSTPIESLGFFLGLGATSALTSSIWFAFPWVFMALFDSGENPKSNSLRQIYEKKRPLSIRL